MLVFVLAVGLAMDAFAVSISAGIRVAPVTGRHIFRLAFHFGLFQFLMPIIGGLLGSGISEYATSWGRWVAFALLTFIGAKMIFDVVRGGHEEEHRGDPTRGWSLLMLSVATSLDALGVGLAYALVMENILLAAVVIGLVAAAFSYIGARFGSYFGEKGGQTAELFGGVLLIGIGVKMLLG